MNVNPSDNPLEWGSHLPALMACLGATRGHVVEFGMGHYSTPVLHSFCVSAGRFLLSVEQNREWFDEFASVYEHPLHRLLCSEYDEVFSGEFMKLEWSVALVDNSPGGERRKKDFLRLIECAEFVVVHDYHKDNEEAISPVLGHLHRVVCSRYQPPTLVASKHWDIPHPLQGWDADRQTE